MPEATDVPSFNTYSLRGADTTATGPAGYRCLFCNETKETFEDEIKAATAAKAHVKKQHAGKRLNDLGQVVDK